MASFMLLRGLSPGWRSPQEHQLCAEKKVEVPGGQGQPQNRVPVGKAGLGTQLQGYRDTSPFPSPINSAQPGNCSVSNNMGAAAVLHGPYVPVVAARSSPALPLTWAGGLQTCCHGKGIQHQLRDPTQAWADACCSCIHRSGSTTSPQAFFLSKTQYMPSVLP